MKIITEQNFRDFEFWSGARETVEYLTPEELDIIESSLEDCYPEGITDGELNDLFWFDEDFIAEILGYESFDQIMERNDT